MIVQAVVSVFENGLFQNHQNGQGLQICVFFKKKSPKNGEQLTADGKRRTANGGRLFAVRRSSSAVI